jgi:uncharacterized protein (DUF4415 family)
VSAKRTPKPSRPAVHRGADVARAASAPAANPAPSRGRADLTRLRRTSEAEIAHTAPPELAELPPEFWETAVPVVPGPKTPISLRVDDDVLAWFRETGPRYQSRMNAVLRSYMKHVAGAGGARPKRRRGGA